MFLNKRHFRADGFSIFQSAALGHRLFLTACLLLATVVLALLFAPSIILGHAFAGPEPNPEEAILVSPFISLSVANNTNNIALDIASLSPNGNFRSSSTVDNIRAYTSNYTGYTLGIAAKVDNDNALSYTPSGSSTTYEIPSIVTSVSAADYADDTYASANGLNNTWGYRPSTLYDVTSDDNVENTDFLPGPTSTVDQTIIAKTKGPNASGNADGYNIAIGARVDSTTPPGSYTNTFVIAAVANSIPYTITYNANDGHDGQDTSNMPVSPEQEIIDATTPTITLPNNAPTRSGYIFKGWCTVQTTDNQATCPGTEYRPGTSLSVDYTTDHITLYARWVDATLWNAVVDEWELGGSRVQTNDTNTDTGIKAPITTSNSGVFKYNSEVFGADSDNTKSDGTKDDIYYFRGILDNTLGTYGSDGDGEAWPNYVILDTNGDGKDASDTCWRIVRTTASGGVKMIYGGTWDTANNTCAHVGRDTVIGYKAFGSQGNSQSSDWDDNINRIGYTFNNDPSIQDVSMSTPVGTVFGDNSNYATTNTADSNIKSYIETWFAGSNGISAYESILEPSAGYCNDRSLFSDGAGDTELTVISPYGNSSSTYFGPYTRNFYKGGSKSLTLTCPRGVVDLYTYKTDNNTNLNGGNGQLAKPVATITADEAALAGNGRSGSSSTGNSHSFLNNGNFIWLLSPFRQFEAGSVLEFELHDSIGGSGVSNNNYVRPTISLAFGTSYASGTGTAADPWVVAPAQE